MVTQYGEGRVARGQTQPHPKGAWPSVLNLYIHISENNVVHVRRHLFHEFLFVSLSFIPDTDDIMTLVQFFVCCITHSFQL